MADIGIPRSRRTRPGLRIALEGTPRQRVSLCLNGLLEGTPTRPIRDVAGQEVVCRSSKAHPGWQRWEKNTWEHAGVLYGLEISSHAGKTQRLRDGQAGKDCDRVKEDGIGGLAGRVALVHRRLHQRFDRIQAACKAFSSLRFHTLLIFERRFKERLWIARKKKEAEAMFYDKRFKNELLLQW